MGCSGLDPTVHLLAGVRAPSRERAQLTVQRLGVPGMDRWAEGDPAGEPGAEAGASVPVLGLQAGASGIVQDCAHPTPRHARGRRPLVDDEARDHLAGRAAEDARLGLVRLEMLVPYDLAG